MHLSFKSNRRVTNNRKHLFCLLCLPTKLSLPVFLFSSYVFKDLNYCLVFFLFRLQDSLLYILQGKLTSDKFSQFFFFFNLKCLILLFIFEKYLCQILNIFFQQFEHVILLPFGRTCRSISMVSGKKSVINFYRGSLLCDGHFSLVVFKTPSLSFFL